MKLYYESFVAIGDENKQEQTIKLRADVIKSNILAQINEDLHVEFNGINDNVAQYTCEVVLYTKDEHERLMRALRKLMPHPDSFRDILGVIEADHQDKERGKLRADDSYQKLKNTIK